MSRALIPLVRIDLAQAAGIPAISVDSLRWQYRNRHATGLSTAFVRVGGRIFLDPDKYHELAREQSARRDVGG